MNQSSAQASSNTVPAVPVELRDSDLHITELAVKALAGLLEEAQAEDSVDAVRVYVSGGGCGGMNYGMTFTDSTSLYDRVFDRDGLKLYIDSVALNYLRGAEIDYVEQGMGASFVFRNAFQAVGGSGGCSACGSAGGSTGGGCA
ncbi:MAG TPA: iron-sulfur cluster assembly accessory protein [Gammaproteobacteria bacterium]